MEFLDSATPSAANVPQPAVHKPTIVIVIGMAGSGKTTVMHRINLHMVEKGLRGYYINLDPAIRTVPFSANIDIRDTINYKEVMKQYNLGPNGSILTSLNLFATRFDQVIELIERRASELDYIFIDTPGQIESFTWSAGGQIILELLGSTYPTVTLYISDATRCVSPTTFMSNMLYCCSILYKSQLPLLLVFNKIDIQDYGFIVEWMNDFEKYLEAVDQDKEEYMNSLNRSLSLVMDEFYNTIQTVGMSAATGEGVDSLFDKIRVAALDYETTYLPELNRKKEANRQAELQRQQKDLDELRKDMKATTV